MLNINPWNMVMIVINLLVLYAIFRKFLYKPVMNVIHRREELIQGQFDSAKKTQDDALQLKADYEEKLQKANVKADEIILAARDQAKEEHEKAVLETQAKTDRMIEKAKADIEKEQKQRIKEQCGDVFKTVDKELAKLKKKLPKLEESLHESQDYMKYKEYGDLLFAYQSQIKKEKIIRLESFETGKMIEIPLDMRFDIKDNATKFYQKYHKLKRGEIILQEQIVQCRKEIEYFEQLQQQLKFCSVEDALEIREELIKQRVLMPKKINQRQKKKKEPNIYLIMKYLEVDSIIMMEHNFIIY